MTDVQSRIPIDNIDSRWLLDQLHSSVIATDLAGIITDWNRGAEQLNGWTADEAIGQHIEILFPDEQAQRTLRQLIDGARSEGQCGAEVLCTRKDSTTYTCRLSIVLLHDREGTPVGMLAVASDTTAFHEANQQLQQALAARDALVQEVHHRVFNNFQVVSSLLSLHARELDCARCEGAIRRACLRVETMARVHGGLYHQREVSSRVPVLNLLGDVLRTVASAQGLGADTIRLTVSPSSAELGMKYAAALAMLTSELVMYLLSGVGDQASTSCSLGLAVVFADNGDGRELTIRVDGQAGKARSRHAPDEMNTFMIPSLCDQLSAVVAWDEEDCDVRVRF